MPDALVNADDDAFLASVWELRPMLVRLAARYVGPDAADDVVQEVLVKLWRRRGDFDSRVGSLSGWATVIARNAALDHRRAQVRLADHVGALDDDRGSMRSAPCGLQSALEREDATIVRAAVRRLDSHQRTALFETYWLGHTNRAVATRSGIPLGTAKGRVRTGLARIKGELGPLLDREVAG